MKKKLMLVVGLAFMATQAMAASLTVADDSSSGTYQLMVKQMNQVFADSGTTLTEVPGHGGALGNLDMLINNEVQAALLHSDVIDYRSKSEDPEFKEQFKTLVALYPEDVHFLVLNKPFKVGGHTAFGHTMGGTDVTLNSISDLAGMPVGAAGGSFITINVIRLQAEINYNAVKYDSGAEVLSALERGDIAAAVFVGAAPLPNLKDLGHDYKLIGVNDSVATKLKAVYKPTTISYPKMQTDSVRTIAPEALLVARVYKTPKFVASLRSFRASFKSHLDEIKETPGMAKAWQKVSSDNKGKWEYYNLNQ